MLICSILRTKMRRRLTVFGQCRLFHTVPDGGTTVTENRINLSTARAMAASQRRSGQSYAADILTTLIAGYTRLARAAGEITDDTPEAYK
jgi:hypothetical protein